MELCAAASAALRPAPQAALPAPLAGLAAPAELPLLLVEYPAPEAREREADGDTREPTLTACDAWWQSE